MFQFVPRKRKQLETLVNIHELFVALTWTLFETRLRYRDTCAAGPLGVWVRRATFVRNARHNTVMKISS
jgi:hypothetical protein